MGDPSTRSFGSVFSSTGLITLVITVVKSQLFHERTRCNRPVLIKGIVELANKKSTNSCTYMLHTVFPTVRSNP
jgi:hypothetical protein